MPWLIPGFDDASGCSLTQIQESTRGHENRGKTMISVQIINKIVEVLPAKGMLTAIDVDLLNQE
jgi:hypothetical protein